MNSTDLPELWPGWKTVAKIGIGSFGAVYRIERSVAGSTEEAALKVISIPQNEGEIDQLSRDGYTRQSIAEIFEDYLKNITNEYKLMRRLSGNTNIVNCEDLRLIRHEDDIGWDLYIKMELLTPMNKLNTDQLGDDGVIRLGIDICKALVLCEQNNIIHRDIKPVNIFMSKDGTFKLGDFGIAKTMEHTSGGTKTGTYEYMAPEVYNNRPYGHSADVYSLGIVLYWMLNERRGPFLPAGGKTPTLKEKEAARAKRFGGEALPPPAHGGDALVQIVLKACAYDKGERWKNAEEMLQALEALRASPEGTAVSLKNTGKTVSFGRRLLWLIIPFVLVASALLLPSRMQWMSAVPAPAAPEADRVDIPQPSPPPSAQPSPPLPDPPVPEAAPPVTVEEAAALPSPEGTGYNSLCRIGKDSREHESWSSFPVWGQPRINRADILEIVFRDSIPDPLPDGAWDASENGDRSVMAWMEGYVLYIASELPVRPSEPRGLFGGFTNLRTVDFNGWLCLDGVYDISYMFLDCTMMKEADLSTLDTSDVQNMSELFKGCKNLRSVNFGEIDISGVTDMSSMFSGCRLLDSVELHGLDTSRVENMSCMFMDCEKLTSVDLRGLDTSSLKYMVQMFWGCEDLKSVYLDGLNTSGVKSMNRLFGNCEELEMIGLEGIDSSGVEDMYGMFSGCSSLDEVDVSGLDTSSAVNMSCMFTGCELLKKLDTSHFDTHNVVNMNRMFYGCEMLEELDVSGFDTSKVTDMSYMFSNCYQVRVLDVSGWDTSKVTTMSYMFNLCREVRVLDVSGFRTSKVTNMSYMFASCWHVTEFDFSRFDTSNVYNMAGMFYNCRSLVKLDISSFNIDKVVSYDYFLTDTPATLDGYFTWERFFTT